jgi:hypothetical protein
MRLGTAASRLLIRAILVAAVVWAGMGVAAAQTYKVLTWEMIENTCPGLSATNFQCLHTERIEVPGGWLVRSTRYDHFFISSGTVPLSMAGGAGVGVGLTFVPDPNHAWKPQ